jgi:hypothetical protein
MQPFNFPGRINHRRTVALMRLQKTNSTSSEIKTLVDRVIDNEIARAIRSKRNHSMRPSFIKGGKNV